jgi:flagellar biosynthetic protein FlhB
MLQKVKTADVVVANPTHVAVAMKYDPATMAAPVVVAKGADPLAAKIREIAEQNGVPIVVRPELARAMYAGVELDQPIPESMFVAVAEVLAMIHRMRKQRQRKGAGRG